LRLHGYTVLEARHGHVLLTSTKYVGPIHLLLTDVVMPQMSGPEVAEKLLIIRPGIKVLYMSGYPDHPVFDQGGVNRETGFLPKPFSPHVLAQSAEILDGVKAAWRAVSARASLYSRTHDKTVLVDGRSRVARLQT
jgi:CheY-like chemotaxis protein